MKISIICPLYNAENYIMNLHNKILEQENQRVQKLRFHMF